MPHRFYRIERRKRILQYKSNTFTTYFIQKLVEGDPAPSVTQDLTDQRLKKIKVYLDESGQFNQQVETFHAESNSSLEAVMQEVVDRYETNKSAP